MQIKALEEELGVPVFDRIGRRVRLTDSGRQALRSARIMLAESERLLRSVLTEENALVRVGVYESLCGGFLPGVIRRFEQEQPGAVLSVVTAPRAELERKLRESKLDLNDYLDQLHQMKKMGSVQDMLGMIPGIKASQLKDVKVDDRQFLRMEAIITSMTPKERENPELINFSRKKRIAAGCGQKVEDVNRLLKQFDMIQQMSKQMAKGGMPNFGPGGMPKMKRTKTRRGGGNGKFKLPF